MGCPTSPEPGGNGPDSDTLLDALAMIEARLRGDDGALSLLLDSGDTRAQASMLADLAAHLLAIQYAAPLEVLARLRPALLAAGGGGG